MSWLLAFILMGIVFLFLQQRRAGQMMRMPRRAGASNSEAVAEAPLVPPTQAPRESSRAVEDESAVAEKEELVRVSFHWPTCERCNEFQGRVYTVKGRSRFYQPLEDLPGAGPPFHPECRHTIEPFEESEVGSEELEKLRSPAPMRQLARKDIEDYHQQKRERIRKAELEELQRAELEGNTSKILQSLLRLVSKNAATPNDLKLLGDTYEKIGKISTAMEAWKRAYKLDRSLPGVDMKLKKYTQANGEAPSSGMA